MWKEELLAWFKVVLRHVFWSEVKWSEVNYGEVKWITVKWNEVKWVTFKWSEVELRWSEAKRSYGEVPWTLGRSYTDGTWLYCDYFIWYVSCTFVVTCFVMCGWVYVGVFWHLCGCLVICVLVFTVFCIVCTEFVCCFVYVYLFLFVLSVLL